MTASTVKSTVATNLLYTTPALRQDRRQLDGIIHGAVDTIEAATTSLDEANDCILMLPLPSNANLLSLKIYNDDLDSGGTAGAVNVGLYNGPESFKIGSTTTAASAVIDADCFATAITTLTAVNTLGVEIRFEAGAGVNGDIADIAKPLWQMAGLTADPKRTFLVGLTVTTQMTTPVAGTITLVAQYID